MTLHLCAVRQADHRPSASPQAILRCLDVRPNLKPFISRFTVRLSLLCCRLALGGNLLGTSLRLAFDLGECLLDRSLSDAMRRSVFDGSFLDRSFADPAFL